MNITEKFPLFLTKYRVNQVLFFGNCLGIFAFFSYALTRNISMSEYIVLFICIGFSQHYFLNIVHLASHSLLSRNRSWNSFFGNISSIIGGVTFSDFRTTHSLHHRFVGQTHKDPDHWITTSGNVFSIPFKIFYHDIYFWKHGLWKNGNWRGYVIDRCAQVGLVLAFWISGNLGVWQMLWLLPLLVVGFCNGLFLFYFPHYTIRIERFARSLEKQNMFSQLLLTTIDISRYYHEKHHEKIQSNRPYFPVFSYCFDKIQKLSPFNNYKPRFVDIQ